MSAMQQAGLVVEIERLRAEKMQAVTDLATFEAILKETQRAYAKTCGRLETGRDDLLIETRNLRAELATAHIALCSLTPGGSEYANDPAACVEYVRRVRNAQHEHILRLSDELATCHNAALEEAAMNLEQRAALIDDSERACHGYDKHGYADFLSAAANAIRALKVAP